LAETGSAIPSESAVTVSEILVSWGVTLNEIHDEENETHGGESAAVETALQEKPMAFS
jgi:hypothetical protein